MRIGENLPSFYTQTPANGAAAFGGSMPQASMPQASMPQASMPQASMPQPAPVTPDAAPAGGNYYSGPGATVDISPAAWTAYRQTGGDNGAAPYGYVPSMQTPSAPESSVPEVPVALGAGKTSETAPAECQTCKNRRYQDQSDDSSVSFQSPSHISPEASFSAVRSHENEHVTNEQAKADKEGRRVVSQTVTLQMASCPECGRMYVAGGVTRTVTANDNREQGQIQTETGGEQQA